MRHLTPGQARDRLADGAVLLDVREPVELELASLPDALHIPLARLPQHLDDLPRDRPLIVMCHHGVRSAMAADFLERSGFTDVSNLEGGIDAWSQTVDERIPRY
ncbi:rhodanese-like domain-containing protein [Natronospira bacteriovora]|uniref:Rhodanese-like domain-containing protein n=1 Tax=Natronospira bacteriovora TaxID=3069753 RepID=A0ABU0W822_9GAMM|nr:rhodanese-like domain-containing protein [Natronospira sp. AB-CW4]MDQ2069610.1 rhodanese-like domain-containing protein [Natronospira sp. AB-CW4]